MVVKIERKRYILVEFHGPVPNVKLLVSALRNSISFLGGQLALAQSSVHIIDIIKNKAIIRSTHNSRDIVEAAIQLLSFDQTVPVVRTVTGTIKKMNQILRTELVDGDE